VRGYA
jgi:hypothetical protein